MRHALRMDTSQHVTQNLTPVSVGMEQAARLIGLSRRQLYRKLATGELHTFRLGGRRLVTYDELKRFIATQAEAA